MIATARPPPATDDAPTPGRLDARQKALAADPRHLQIASNIAARYARSIPRLADEFRSAAFLALCQAALTFEPRRKVSFTTHATNRVNGAMLDLYRGLAPTGFRRRDREDFPAILSLDAPIVDPRTGWPDDSTPAEAHPADDGPVGWEAEYQDEIEGIIRDLPDRHREVVRLLYGHADTARMKRVAAGIGLSASRVSQIHAEAVVLLADRVREEADRARAIEEG